MSTHYRILHCLPNHSPTNSPSTHNLYKFPFPWLFRLSFSDSPSSMHRAVTSTPAHLVGVCRASSCSLHLDGTAILQGKCDLSGGFKNSGTEGPRSLRFHTEEVRPQTSYRPHHPHPICQILPKSSSKASILHFSKAK